MTDSKNGQNTEKHYLRGNEMYFKDQWRYVDTDQPTIEGWQKRPCGHCKLPNRPDEHDACLGELPGVMNACCGHGSESEAYVQFVDESILRGEQATAAFRELRGR